MHTTDRRRVRFVAAVLAWLAAVGVATAIGLTAVGAIGDGIVGSGPQPLRPDQVDALLAGSTTAPAPERTPAAPAPSIPPGPEVLTSRGGTVVARCVDGTVQVVSASPAQGYRVHDEAGEDPGRVRFDSDAGRVELRLGCRDGRPVAETRVDG